MSQPHTTHKYAAADNSPEELTQFALFPKLPPELRLKIWEVALPTVPRIVEFERPYHKGLPIEGTNGFWFPVQHSCTPIHALAAVSREARAVFMAEHCFIDDDCHPPQPPVPKGSGLFNVTWDTLYLSGTNNADFHQPWQCSHGLGLIPFNTGTDYQAILRRQLTDNFGCRLVANLRFLAIGTVRLLFTLKGIANVGTSQAIPDADLLSAFISQFPALEELILVMKDIEASFGDPMPTGEFTLVELSEEDEAAKERDFRRFTRLGRTINYAALQLILSRNLGTFYLNLSDRSPPKVSFKRALRGGKRVEEIIPPTQPLEGSS